MKAAARQLRSVLLLLAIATASAAVASPLPAGLPDLPGLAPLVTTEARSGLALGGIDVVSYHADGGARPGSETFELVLGDTVWRFASAANRAAFAEAPAAYAPAFGGLDPIALAEGRTVDGSPRHFVVKDGRLYLFGSAETRKRFAADDIARAKAAWVASGQQLFY